MRTQWNVYLYSSCRSIGKVPRTKTEKYINCESYKVANVNVAAQSAFVWNRFSFLLSLRWTICSDNNYSIKFNTFSNIDIYINCTCVFWSAVFVVHFACFVVVVVLTISTKRAINSISLIMAFGVRVLRFWLVESMILYIYTCVAFWM